MSQSDNEIRYLLKVYNQLPIKIKQLELQLSKVSMRFYESHSLCGVANMNHDVPDHYQNAISPEMATLWIISEETRLKKQIQRLKESYELIGYTPLGKRGSPLTSREQEAYSKLITRKPEDESDAEERKREIESIFEVLYELE